MFERMLKDFAMKMIPQLLPDLLRGLADQIEQGNISIPREMVSAAIEAREDEIKSTAAEIAQ